MPTDTSVNLSTDEKEKARFDQSTRAEVMLDSVLSEETPEEIITRSLSTSDVDTELHAAQIVETDSNRQMTRVLFITRDQSYLDQNHAVINRMLLSASLFQEIHILVLMPTKGEHVTKRVIDNMWVYTVHATAWWKTPAEALDVASGELTFGDGFRPDIIVALDPFESGWAGLKIAKAFDRPLQVHVSEDFYRPNFPKREKGNNWRVRLAKFVLKRTKSVRTTTAPLQEKIAKRFTKIPDVQVLPTFYNFKSLFTAKPQFDVHEKYADYVFVALAFGPLTADSSLQDTFSAMHTVLQNPRIGLIVIGDGPAKSMYEEKAKLLGIERNVVFVDPGDDLISYYKTADVLIQTDVTEAGDAVVLKAAAAGLPVIMYRNEFRDDLFEDGTHATVCEPNDIYTFTQNINTFLNNIGLRKQYTDAARHLVETRLVEDETTYYRAFRDSIELAINSERNDV